MLGMIGGILSGLGGLSGLLGSLGLGRQKVEYENVNPFTNDTMNQFQGLLNSSDSNMNRLLSGAEGSANRLSGIDSLLHRLSQGISNINSPSVDAGYNLFNQRSNNLLNLGENAAERFTSPFREKGSDIAQRRASEAARNIMSQFGGSGFSGAANAAASQASTDVMSDYENQLAQMFGSIGSNISGNALNQERGLAEQAPQTLYANMLNNLLQQAQLAQARGATIGQQAGLLGSLGGQYGARSQNLLSNIGALSAPQFQEPVYESPLNALGQGLSGMGSMFSNPDFQNLFEKPGAGTPIQPMGDIDLSNTFYIPGSPIGFINKDLFGPAIQPTFTLAKMFGN